MNKNPLVSIVIPVYNGSNYLREAIDSALAQTYSNFEVIVVNDGSNDNGETEKIALSYGDKIRYFAKENGGVATALNLGIKEMKGEYFSWLSHDDLYYPNKLEMQIKALKECGDMTRIVITDYDAFYQENKKSNHIKLNQSYFNTQIENSVFSVLQGLVHGCAMLIHKSHFERVGNFNEKLITTQDYDLWFRMFRGQKILYLPEFLTISRLHLEQGTNTIPCVSDEQQELYLGFVNKLSEEEMIDMYKSEANFYSKMLNFLRRNKMGFAFEQINKRFQKLELSDESLSKLREIRGFLFKISNGRAKKICVFGSGKWGINLYYELKSKLINIDYFCDNDNSKIGYLLDNKECISFNSLKDMKDEVLVIIATKFSTDAIKKQLQDNGFKFITTKQELDKKFFDIPELKWMNTLYGIENLDYAMPEIQLLLEKFRDTIFDICRYYEGKINK